MNSTDGSFSGINDADGIGKIAYNLSSFGVDYDIFGLSYYPFWDGTTQNMQTVAKVFIIIGMVVGFWSILPLIFGIIALKKLKTATKKDDLVVTAVLTLLFCNILGGIFMLLIKDEDLADNAK